MPSVLPSTHTVPVIFRSQASPVQLTYINVFVFVWVTASICRKWCVRVQRQAFSCNHVLIKQEGPVEIPLKRTKPHGGRQMGKVLNSNCQRCGLKEGRRPGSKILFVINQRALCVSSRHTGMARFLQSFWKNGLLEGFWKPAVCFIRLQSAVNNVSLKYGTKKCG